MGWTYEFCSYFLEYISRICWSWPNKHRNLTTGDLPNHAQFHFWVCKRIRRAINFGAAAGGNHVFSLVKFWCRGVKILGRSRTVGLTQRVWWNMVELAVEWQTPPESMWMDFFDVTRGWYLWVCKVTGRSCWRIESLYIHPGRLTWNLQITHLERKMIFQTSMIMFHVNLQGCNWIQPDWSFGLIRCRVEIQCL